MTRSRCLLVVGMHRGGTSSLAGALRILGVSLGEDLVAPREGENPLGFFENTRVLDFHERLLGEMGRSWHDLTLSEPDWATSSRVEPFAEELVNLLRDEFGAATLWGVKDPRLCRLLPLWLNVLEVLEVTPEVILIHRHPHEVAGSLQRRNRFSADKGSALWVDHMLSAERLTRDLRRVFVGYEKLLADPASALVGVGEALDLRWKPSATVSGELRDFVRPTLRHRVHDDNSAPWCAEPFFGIAERLNEILVAQQLTDGRECGADMDALRLRFDEALGELDSVVVDHVRDRSNDAISVVNELRHRVEESTSWLQAHEVLIERQKRRLDEVRRHIDDAMVTMERQQRQLGKDQSRFQETTPTIDDLHRLERGGTEIGAQIADLVKRLDTMDRTMEASNRSRISGIQEQVNTRDARLDRLDGALVDRRAEHEGLAGRVHDQREELEALDARLRQESEEWQRGELRRVAQAHAQLESMEHTRQLVEMLWSSKPWRLYVRLARMGRWFRRRGRRPNLGASVERLVEEQHPDEVDRAQRLELRTSETPTVSIVIPVYNQLEHTLTCLESIASTPSNVPHEVIVVDDCSDDATPQELAEVSGLRVLRNETNLGFVGSCNRGAQEARGDYLLFLNNDTIVLEGWIDRMLRSFDDFPDSGVVGAKLVSPDGTLSEAGGIIFRDGSGCNYGRGGHSDAPEYNYARQVDYCSGACLLVPRALFVELGMFDTSYSPAYYEDVDLAFRARAAGKTVRYQPTATVVHVEGVTCGTDTSSGVKEHQVINQQVFRDRWEEELAGHRPPGASPDDEARRYSGRRILVIDHRVPEPDRDAGSVRMFHVLQLMMEAGHHVTFAPDNLHDQQPYTRRLQSLGVEVVHAPFVNSIRTYLRENGGSFDVVLLSRRPVAEKHINVVRKHAPKAKVIFDTVDLHFLREQRMAALTGDQKLASEAEKARAEELSLARQADVTLVVSSAEQELLTSQGNGLQARVLSLIHDAPGSTASFGERTNVAFVGGFQHPPNVDAARWLINDIFPLVREYLPGVHLYVVGSDVPSEILALSCDDITVTGHQPDLTRYLSGCRVAVAPIRFGAGVQGKVTQSLAHGLPCVVTTLAAEAIGLEDGVDAMIADDQEAFAKALAKLYVDEQLWERLSAAGTERIRRQFSFAAARGALDGVLEELLGVAESPVPPAAPRHATQ